MLAWPLAWPSVLRRFTDQVHRQGIEHFFYYVNMGKKRCLTHGKRSIAINFEGKTRTSWCQLVRRHRALGAYYCGQHRCGGQPGTSLRQLLIAKEVVAILALDQTSAVFEKTRKRSRTIKVAIGGNAGIAVAIRTALCLYICKFTVERFHWARTLDTEKPPLRTTGRRISRACALAPGLEVLWAELSFRRCQSGQNVAKLYSV